MIVAPSPGPTPNAYLARLFLETTLPHRRPSSPEFLRRNGHTTLHLQAPSQIGLPYGTYPRWFLLWLSTEAVRTKSPHLHLGPSLSHFMDRLGLTPTSGKRGTKHQLRQQIRRLLATTFRWTRTLYPQTETPKTKTPHTETTRTLVFTHHHHLAWTPGPASEPFLWPSTLTLTHELFAEIIHHAVPLDPQLLRYLHPSSFAMDLYTWLSWRTRHLEKPCKIPWGRLQEQFGADYGRPRDFRRYFRRYLEQVRRVKPGLRVNVREGGVVLGCRRSRARAMAVTASPAPGSE